MQLNRGGECLACKGGSRTTNPKPQQPLIGMIFTNADPRYAGRLDDKHGGDIIVTMERVREAIAFNAELVDESTWLWLTSEQPFRPTGGGEHEERAEDLDSSQGVRDHLVAYHLAPAITDFISDKNWECCNNDLEQTLTLLHSEWSKEIEPSRQGSTHHPLIVSNAVGPLTRKVRSSCVEACGGKRPRCQQLHMTLECMTWGNWASTLDLLQCVAVCCSVLQCVAVCCSVLQCVAVCCSVLHCRRSNVLAQIPHITHSRVVLHCSRSNVLAQFPHVTHSRIICKCNTLQHTATHCNTLQHTATHCNTLQ